MITIYLIAYNEVVMLPHTVRFYRGRFPGCRIMVYDNFSTDRTKSLAKELGCEVMDFYTNDKLSDQVFLNIKNNCWKTAGTDWVVVCDVDEWLDIWPEDLNDSCTIIRSWFVNMVNPKDNFDVWHMNLGYRHISFPGKFICFNKKYIEDINYHYGCHEAMPVGKVVFSEKIYDLLHYKFINLKYAIDRYKEFANRLSVHNLKNKLSYHYLFSARRIKKDYLWHLKRATPWKKSTPPTGQ